LKIYVKKWRNVTVSGKKGKHNRGVRENTEKYQKRIDGIIRFWILDLGFRIEETHFLFGKSHAQAQRTQRIALILSILLKILFVLCGECVPVN
jgi:hypothetical protein